MTVAVRTSAVIIALAVAGWYAVGIRQAHGTDGATAIVTSERTLSAGQAARADALLHEASLLNPDQEVNILRGAVASASGHEAQAVRILESVTRAEPQNLEAWLYLAKAATTDYPLFYRALVRVRRLEPVVRSPKR